MLEGRDKFNGEGSLHADAVPTTRTVLLRSSVALVEDLRSAGVPWRHAPEDYSAAFQVCLPYHGVFVWHVASDEVVGDPNQVLFVQGGEPFRIAQRDPHPYAELIITPGRTWHEPACHESLSRHPLFRQRSRRADPRLQLALARLRHQSVARLIDNLYLEEAVVHLLQNALETTGPIAPPSVTTRRLLGRTKEFLHAHLVEPLRLDDIAQAAGVSAPYLTDLFRRLEGVSLHRYLTQLRLARALVDLPHCSDLTTLALALGFSSHSHFTATFRRVYGCTPSVFRAATTRDQTKVSCDVPCQTT